MSSSVDAEQGPHSRALLLAVRQLYAAIERFDTSVAHVMGIDRSSLRAVNAMERGEVFPSDLAEHLGLTTGSVTALLDRLEGAGHIARTLSAQDRRRRGATLTTGTRAKAKRSYARLGKSLSLTFAEESENFDLQLAVKVIERLAKSFDAARAGAK
jgi:DNA-binding MarR family transcriptional regulator